MSCDPCWSVLPLRVSTIATSRVKRYLRNIVRALCGYSPPPILHMCCLLASQNALINSGHHLCGWIFETEFSARAWECLPPGGRPEHCSAVPNAGQDGRFQKGFCMRNLNCLLIALVSALIAVYMVLWLTKPPRLETTTIPPPTFKRDQGELTIWGGWKTVEGYDSPGTSAVEIHCSCDHNTCSEALATILHHSTGEDLETQVFNYQIVLWDESGLEALAERAIDGFLDRRLVISLKERAAVLKWMPSPCCDGDTERSLLVGDPL